MLIEHNTYSPDGELIDSEKIEVQDPIEENILKDPVSHLIDALLD